MPARALAVAFAVAGPVAANEAPLSAIDWLSQSVDPSVGATSEHAISVEPLGRPPAALGLVDPEPLGLPPALWSGSDAADLARSIADMPSGMPLPMRDALALAVSLRAPVRDPDQAFLLARVDALLALGRLEAARQLVVEAGIESAELFRRAFDIALLTGHENEGCTTLRDRPDLAPTYPARIFCLARLGDWQAAALTLETAQALDVLTPEETALLGRFLDDGDGAMLPPPRRPDTVTPLVYRLYDAIGEPLSTRALPLAFAHADLRPENGWKTRLEAGERLFRAGALGREEMLALYLEKAPAASGGVWDRAAAVQAWQAARPPDATAARADAVAALSDAGLKGVVPGAAAGGMPRPRPNVPPDRDLAAMIDAGRIGEAALVAIARAANAWNGDPDDLARALAALSAAGLWPLPEDAARLARR